MGDRLKLQDWRKVPIRCRVASAENKGVPGNSEAHPLNLDRHVTPLGELPSINIYPGLVSRIQLKTDLAELQQHNRQELVMLNQHAAFLNRIQQQTQAEEFYLRHIQSIERKRIKQEMSQIILQNPELYHTLE
eukprot:m.109407 g.109407  ORF g.109407 m.109407 type:complete len:133 (-) comp27954_c0_seq2:41-439(-)